MRFIHFSDLHLDSPFSQFRPQAARKRRQALRRTLERIIELAEDTKADALLCGGDLFEHDRVSPDTGNFIRSCFERLHPTPVFLAPGNHDWYGPASLYHLAQWSPNVHVFTEPRLQPVQLERGLTLWGAAHCGPANTDGFLDGFRVERDGVNLALFHGSERGFFTAQSGKKAPHAPFDRDQIAEAGLSHAFLGHYHRARLDDLYTYPGNPDPLCFGEDDQRGAVEITVSPTRELTRVHHRVATTSVHDLRVDIGSCTNWNEVARLVASTVEGLEGFARFTIEGRVHPDLDLRLDELDNLPELQKLDGLVVVRGRLETAYDIQALADEETVRGAFVRHLHEVDLDDDLRNQVIETGLRALAGRSDLEVAS